MSPAQAVAAPVSSGSETVSVVDWLRELARLHPEYPEAGAVAEVVAGLVASTCELSADVQHALMLAELDGQHTAEHPLRRSMDRCDVALARCGVES